MVSVRRSSEIAAPHRAMPANAPSQPHRAPAAEVDRFERTLRREARAPAVVDAPAVDAAESSPVDDVVERAFQDVLGRSAGAGGFWHEWAGGQLLAGHSMEEVDSGLRAHLEASTEKHILQAHAAVDDLHEELLGWRPGGKGYWHDEAQRIVEEGGSVDDARAHVRWGIQQSEEYRVHHPTRTRPAAEVALRQPNGFTCGPTSLTMALAHWGLGDATHARVQQIAAETGTNRAGEFPGGPALIASAAGARGLQATSSTSRELLPMKAALDEGKTLIVNGSMVGRDGSLIGHFVYVAGTDEQGRFIVNDPADGSSRAWSDAEMSAFTHRGPNPPGFASLWRSP